MKHLITLLVGIFPCIGYCHAAVRPNIVFAIADDWGWPHASVYGNDEVCQTPTFDEIAKSGVLFNHAYVSSPSCTPSRNAILTGKYHWQLGSGANLWSTLDTKHKTYPLLLEDTGYHVGSWRKSWGPGNRDNWDRHPAGKVYKSPGEFLEAWDRTQPFCFWLGSSDPHRPYELGSGKAAGLDPNKVKLFGHFPDCETIRSDVADYYFEVQRFDRDVGEFLSQLDTLSVLENTIVVMTGDHGMPFPRCKSNVYDSGARVPLAISWPQGIEYAGRVLDDFVSTTDLAPTFLELAGVEVPAEVVGRSLRNLLASDQQGRVDPARDHVLIGKERHTVAQEAPDTGGTPMRAIRTHEFLLIHNYRTDRWPAGTPNHERATIPGAWYSDCDNSPTKQYIIANLDKDAEHRQKYELAFGKRPEFELYDLRVDPDQLHNIADASKYADTVRQLSEQLHAELLTTNDPRALGKGDETFGPVPYLGGAPKYEP